ncbi:MAG: hypothetical protein R3C24_09950 [Cyanobacteriota/Melainabacteria group bacterium]
MKDIVESAGTGFAFPSRSIYVDYVEKPDVAAVSEEARPEAFVPRLWRTRQLVPLLLLLGAVLVFFDPNLFQTSDLRPAATRTIVQEQFRSDLEWNRSIFTQLFSRTLESSSDSPR